MELTKKKLLEIIKNVPDDATITISTGGNYQNVTHAQYNELGNEIIIDSFSDIPEITIDDGIVHVHTNCLSGLTVDFKDVDDEDDYFFTGRV